MGRYRKVDVRIWDDPKFRRLDSAPKLAFICLLTHPQMTSIGAMRATTAASLAEDLNWTPGEAAAALSTLSDLGMVRHDDNARLVWLPNFLRYNPPENPNVARGFASALAMLPECDLRADAARAACAACNATPQMAEHFRRGLAEEFSDKASTVLGDGAATASDAMSTIGHATGAASKPLSYGFETVAEPLHEPFLNPEPEPEPEPEPKPDSTTARAGDLAAVPQRASISRNEPPSSAESPLSAFDRRNAALELIETWRAATGVVVDVAGLSGADLRRFSAALQQRDLAVWRRIFEAVASSDYLSGRDGQNPPITLWRAIDLAARIESGEFAERRKAPAKAAGLRGGGVPVSATASRSVKDPDTGYRFVCEHSPTCATWPSHRDLINSETPREASA
jgi:hypothetical protein